MVSHVDNRPLYLQLEGALKEQIISGVYPVGSRTPTEQELCREHGVSRITVRRAVQDLVGAGLLETVQGRGTFVAVPKHESTTIGDGTRGFSSLTSLGATTKREVLSAERTRADEKIASKLQIAVGDEVTHMRRLILQDGYPISIDELYASSRLLPGLMEFMSGGESFYGLVRDKYGIQLGEEDAIIEVSSAKLEESELLKCVAGAPLFVLRKLMCCADGTPLHYSKTVLRGDRVSYHFHVGADGKIVDRAVPAAGEANSVSAA